MGNCSYSFGTSDLDRTDILDKYNFLALPGSSCPPLKTNLQSARYFNYKCLVDILSGKATPSQPARAYHIDRLLPYQGKNQNGL